MALLIDAIVRAADLRAGETALDLDAQTPLATLALARTGDAATGVAPNHRSVGDAWDAAGWNGVTNAMFSTRDPLAVLAARRRPDVVVVAARGPGLAPAMLAAVVRAGVPRVAYVARSLPACAADLVAWRRAGYAVALVQPVALLPQTSRVHLVATLRRIR
jgi:SAM-dependent methyltransferases related to tRNA (uracil-5-)-methyltransferase